MLIHRFIFDRHDLLICFLFLIIQKTKTNTRNGMIATPVSFFIVSDIWIVGASSQLSSNCIY